MDGNQNDFFMLLIFVLNAALQLICFFLINLSHQYYVNTIYKILSALHNPQILKLFGERVQDFLSLGKLYDKAPIDIIRHLKESKSFLNIKTLHLQIETDNIKKIETKTKKMKKMSI